MVELRWKWRVHNWCYKQDMGLMAWMELKHLKPKDDLHHVVLAEASHHNLAWTARKGRIEHEFDGQKAYQSGGSINVHWVEGKGFQSPSSQWSQWKWYQTNLSSPHPQTWVVEKRPWVAVGCERESHSRWHRWRPFQADIISDAGGSSLPGSSTVLGTTVSLPPCIRFWLAKGCGILSRRAMFRLAKKLRELTRLRL